MGLHCSTELPSEEGPANFTPSYMLTAAPCKQKHLLREMSKPYFVDLRQLRTGLGGMNRWMLKIILDSEGTVRLRFFNELKNHTWNRVLKKVDDRIRTLANIHLMISVVQCSNHYTTSCSCQSDGKSLLFMHCAY